MDLDAISTVWGSMWAILDWLFCLSCVFCFPGFLSFLVFLGVDLSDRTVELRVDLGVLGVDLGELAVHLAVDLDAL